MKVISVKVLVIVMITLIGLIYFSFDEIKSLNIHYQEKSYLPHYTSSAPLSSEAYATATSQSIILPGAPGVLERLLAAGQIDSSTASITQLHIINDTVAEKYYVSPYSYIRSAYDAYYVIPHDLSSSSPYEQFSLNNNLTTQNSFPIFDERWKATGGMACFSCGCDCYMDEYLHIAGGKFYMSITGEDFAIRPEFKGLYFYKDSTSSWIRITPEVGTAFKIVNDGCTVYYSFNDSTFQLNTCSL